MGVAIAFIDKDWGSWRLIGAVEDNGAIRKLAPSPQKSYHHKELKGKGCSIVIF
jgi:hypothetical protein